MHPKFTLAILIIGISAVAKGQASRNDSTKTSGKETLTTYQQGHVYDILIVNDKMIGLEVDNKRIEPADFHRYDSIVKAIKAEMKEDDDHAEAERAEQKRDWEQAGRDREQGERDREQAVRDRAQGEQDRQQAGRDQEQAVRERQQARQEQQQAIQERQQGDRDREQGQRDREQGDRDRKEGERDREQGERDREAAKEERRQMRNLIRELVDEKIIPDAQSLNSMVLTETQFIVNGTKQPQQVLQKIKVKYPSFVHAGLTYGDCDCQTDGTTIHFNGQYPGY
jgi:colicin import membrane protein